MATETEMTTDVIQGFISWMSWGGCNPYERGWAKRFLGYMFVTTSMLIVVFVGVNFLATPHSSVSSLMEDSLMLFGFLQIGAKHFSSMQKSDNLVHILDSLWHDFWSLDSLPEPLKSRFLLWYRRANMLANAYGTVIMSTVILFIIQSGLARSLVMEIWVPHKQMLKTSPTYEVVYVLQAVYLITSTFFCLVQLDKMFIMLTCFVCVQMRMLQNKLLQVQEIYSAKENFNTVRYCVIYHNVLLKFLENFEVVFSQLFLPTLLSSFALSSLSIYGALMEESLNRKLTLIFVYLSVTGQLFAYCYAGHLIQEEGSKVATAAYNCGWSALTDNQVKRSLMMIVVRAQRGVQLTAGGIMVLSLENFAAVVRASFSFLTFIVNVRTT